MDFVHPVEAVIPGVQGRVLAVLVDTTAELSLRTSSRLAGVSVAQASRVLPGLVELGLVERREVPPSSQFRLVRSNVGARAVIDLARSMNSVLESIGAGAAALPIPPASVIVFGSFARGSAGRESDVDVVVVRPDEISEDDDAWSASIESWRNESTATAGNTVQILEVSTSEAQARLRGNKQLWRDIDRDGVVIHGMTIRELSEAVHAQGDAHQAVSGTQVRAYAGKAKSTPRLLRASAYGDLDDRTVAINQAELDAQIAFARTQIPLQGKRRTNHANAGRRASQP